MTNTILVPSTCMTCTSQNGEPHSHYHSNHHSPHTYPIRIPYQSPYHPIEHSSNHTTYYCLNTECLQTTNYWLIVLRMVHPCSPYHSNHYSPPTHSLLTPTTHTHVTHTLASTISWNRILGRKIAFKSYYRPQITTFHSISQQVILHWTLCQTVNLASLLGHWTTPY